MKSKGLNQFVWPAKMDQLTCPMSGALCLVSDPVKVNDVIVKMSLSKENYNTAEAAVNSKRD